MTHFTENLHFSGTSSTKPTEPEVRPVNSKPEAAVPASALSGKHLAICCSFLPEMSWQPPCVSDCGNPPCWRARQGQGLDRRSTKSPDRPESQGRCRGQGWRRGKLGLVWTPGLTLQEPGAAFKPWQMPPCSGPVSPGPPAGRPHTQRRPLAVPAGGRVSTTALGVKGSACPGLAVGGRDRGWPGAMPTALLAFH